MAKCLLLPIYAVLQEIMLRIKEAMLWKWWE